MSTPLDVAVPWSADELDRRAAARDLWPGGTLDFWQRRDPPLPDRVYWPENDDQLAVLLGACSREGVPVVPYGAGSGVCGGARGRQGSVVVDTKRLSRWTGVDVDRWTVEVEAGVNGQQLEDHLARSGFTLGHSPSSIGCSTVGGWAAARSAGQFSSKYGVFEDMVTSVEGVAPALGRFRVGEGGNSPEDWMELMLGSEGTLAVLTRFTLRVWPAPETRWLRGYRFPTVAAALRAMRALMQGELWPSVVRLYDPVDTRIGGRTRPKREAEDGRRSWYRRWLARVDRIPSVHKRSLVLPLSLPGLVNGVFGRLASGCLLVVGWEGPAAVVEAQSRHGDRLLREGGEDLGPGPGERWLAARHAVSYKLIPVFERGGFADTMEVAARWSDLEALYTSVRAALSETTVVMAHMSHVYPEGGCIYFSFAGRGDATVYQRTWDAALAAAESAGATVTHHHGVGFLKAHAATREVGAAVAGWREAKAVLDPAGILNPGRLFVEAAPVDSPAPPALRSIDGLARAGLDSDLETRRMAARRAGGEVMWPWERLPAPPRWHRNHWQTGWTEVAGTVADTPPTEPSSSAKGGSGEPSSAPSRLPSGSGWRCVLGRAPRSAAGPDLRPWLASRAPGATATFAVAPPGERWWGVGRPSHPWAVARELLRADLRPAVLCVLDGALHVGFRGPAAADLGAVASSLVPGGLEVVPEPSDHDRTSSTAGNHPATPIFRPRDLALPAGPLERCALDDPDVVAVLPDGARRRRRP